MDYLQIFKLTILLFYCLYLIQHGVFVSGGGEIVSFTLFYIINAKYLNY
jgi:hypothetical protein